MAVMRLMLTLVFRLTLRLSRIYGKQLRRGYKRVTVRVRKLL